MLTESFPLRKAATGLTLPEQVKHRFIALGIAIVFWPIFFIAQIAIAKRIFPGWFMEMGPGITGVGPGAEILNQQPGWTPQNTILSILVFSVFCAALLGWLVYKAESRKTQTP